MWINNLLKLPIVKLIAMFAMLYYIFEKTKEDPKTIAYHIKKENIGKSLEIINQNISIGSDIKLKMNDESSDQENKKSTLNYYDVRQGSGEREAICGSEVFIEYAFMGKENNNIINKSNMKFEIGSRFNELIERSLIGMTAGGVRVVDIPQDFKTGDASYDEMIQNSKMVYKILLLSVSEATKNDAVCYE